MKNESAIARVVPLGRVKGKEKGPLSAEGTRVRGDQATGSNGNDSHFRACRRKRSFLRPHASKQGKVHAESKRHMLLSSRLSLFSLSFSSARSTFSRRRSRNSVILLAQWPFESSSASLFGQAEEREYCVRPRHRRKAEKCTKMQRTV